jgi:hypothetical protein
MTYSPQFEEYRQMMHPFGKEPEWDSRMKTEFARLFHYSGGSGIAMVRRVKNCQHTRPAFYQFAACEHVFEDVRNESRMCYHVSRCIKCGYKTAVDSSD